MNMNRKLMVLGGVYGFLVGLLLGYVAGATDVSVHVYVSDGPAVNDGTDSGVGCTDDCLDAELSTDLASPSVPEEGI